MTFKIWSPEEIWRPLEEPDYLVEALLVRGSLSLLVAYGSSFKTWAWQDLGLSIAAGLPWLERFPTRQGGALLIDFESGDYELRRRSHRLALGRGIRTPLDGFAFVTMPDSTLMQDEFFEQVKTLAQVYKFIGIDSLSAGSAGLDENTTKFAHSLQRLKAIAASTGCCIMVLHHARKTEGKNGHGPRDTVADPRQGVRGTSAIFNACDVVLSMQQTASGRMIFSQIKSRGGKSVQTFQIVLEDTGPESTVVRGIDAPAEDAEDPIAISKRIARCKAQIVALFQSEPKFETKDQVYRRIHGTKIDKVRAFRELADSGRLVQVGSWWTMKADS